jgi:hypothetical protein
LESITKKFRNPAIHTTLYQGGAIEDDFGVRYHFNQIKSLNNPDPVLIHVINYDTNTLSDEKKMYVPTDIIGAFRYVPNKERNISSTRAIKIQAGLTIQTEKHSKTPMKIISRITVFPMIMLLMKLDMITKTNLKCFFIYMYFYKRRRNLKI